MSYPTDVNGNIPCKWTSLYSYAILYAFPFETRDIKYGYYHLREKAGGLYCCKFYK